VVRYKRDLLALYGLTIEGVNRVIRSAFAGEKAGVVFEGERRFDLVVRLAENYRQNLRSLENLRINKPAEELVLLKHVADITFEKGPMQISRDDTKRRVTIGINVRNRDVESFVREVQEILKENVDLPPGYYFSYGGQFENLQDARRSSSIAVPIALAAIFVLLYFAFYSLKQAIMIFTAIPLSAVGGIWALYLRDMPFSISAGVGFIALFGVAVLNGIVLISYYNQLKKEGVEDIYERVLRGTRMRLRPVVMTAAVAALGFIPMALSTAPGAEVQRPLATVVIGGLITATFLTLVVLPVIYVLFDKISGSKTSIKASIAVLFILPTFPVMAQQNQQVKEIDLQQAIELAVKNNPLVTNADLKVIEAKMEKKASVDIPNPTLEYERGQINSSLIDYYLSISQELHFPTVYSSRAGYNRELIRLSELESADARLILAGSVKEVYYRWMMLDLVRAILERQDSLYTEFRQATDIMYEAGDIKYLNKVTAETRAARVEIELERVKMEMDAVKIQLRQLLNIDRQIELLPEKTYVLPLPVLPDSSKVEVMPVLQKYKQQVEVMNALIKTQKHRLFPDLKAGYFTQSLDEAQGFSGWQVGINIPLWFWSYQGEIKSARIRKEQALNEYQYQLRNIFLEIERLNNLVKSQLELLEYYRDQVVGQSEVMLQQAEISYQEGEIDYIEFLQNASEAYDLQIEYLRVVNDYNQAVIQLEYFLGRTYNIENQ
jgi:cobalt-zinc-cadmium resistance protein CzcA